VEIPVLGDADTGFGNAINAHRTVQEYIRAGAAGLFIEDQVLPKRCGHMRGKQVISKPEMLGKLRAAMDARNGADPDFVIMCRIDAIAVNGFEDALDRAKAAVDLGVDMIFVEALETRDQMERVGREIAVPLMLNLIEGGRTPLVTYREAEELGFKYVAPALTALSAAAKGMYEVMRRVREEGVSNAYLDRLFTFQEFARVVHLDRFREMEERYLPSDQLEERYKGERTIV
jgi:2,3-dimethylmalate lyase